MIRKTASLCFCFLFLFGCVEEQLALMDVVSIEVKGESLSPANGSEVEVIAQIPSNSDRDKRTIAFSTDLGTFINGQKTVSILANSDGAASAFLKSSEVGTATVTATVNNSFKASTYIKFIYAKGIQFSNQEIENLTADNVTLHKLEVKIDLLATGENKIVQFATDKGVFTNISNSIKVESDSEGKAVAYIKSNTSGLANITATNQTFTAKKIVNFTSSGAVFFEKPEADTVSANGYSEIVLSAYTDPNVEAAKTTITFSTDIGSFENNQKTIAAQINPSGKAIARLKSSNIGTATVTIKGSSTLSASKIVVFIPSSPDQIFDIKNVVDQVPSDGVSVIAIPIELNKNLSPNERKVTFITSGGTFQTGNSNVELQFDVNGRATAFLKHNLRGQVFVSVTSGNVTKNLSLNFSESKPDFIFISGNSSLKNGLQNGVDLTINLKRNIGTPNSNFLFDYNAVDDAGKEIGVFFNGTPSGNDGKASVRFSTNNSSYTGKILVTISLKGYPEIKANHTLIVEGS